MNKKTKQDLAKLIETNTYDLLSNLNKIISKSEQELQMYFFENVNDEDLNGKIDIPLIYKPYSDFEKVKTEIRELESKIKFIDKQINNPSYIIARITDGIYTDKNNNNINIEVEEEIKKLKKEREKYESKIRLIKENPKMYLRFNEFKKSDFKSIKDPKVRMNLEKKRMELKMYENYRKNILASISEKNEESKIYLYKKKSNKHIDNE